MKGLKNLLQREGAPPPPPPRPSPRQLWYGGLFLSSLVALGSTLEAVRAQRHHFPVPPTSDAAAQQRWAVGSTATTFFLSFAMVAMHATPRTARLLAGTKLEMGLILVVAGSSCAAVGTATNPATGLAVNASGGIGLGNLYYSAWASFGCGMALLVSFLRTERGMDVPGQLEARGRRFRLWAISIIASLVAMGSSASSYDARCGEGSDFRPPKYCRRAAFGVSAGCIGCVVALAVVAMRSFWTKREDGGGGDRPNKAMFVVECACSAVLLCFYCFAAGYLTGEEGPGAPLGNLYYSTWIVFGLILSVAVSCFEEFQAATEVYLRNQQSPGGGATRGGVSSIESISHGERVGVPHHGNNAPAEANRKEENGFQQAAPLIGNRSGSVGEVQI